MQTSKSFYMSFTAHTENNLIVPQIFQIYIYVCTYIFFFLDSIYISLHSFWLAWGQLNKEKKEKKKENVLFEKSRVSGDCNQTKKGSYILSSTKHNSTNPNFNNLNQLL